MSKEIIINPKVRFGKPTIANTRITVEEVLGALESGMDFQEIEREYGLTKRQITAAIKYLNGWFKGETTKSYEVPA